MVCSRCVLVVKQELKKLKLLPALVSMGEVELSRPATDKQLKNLNERLNGLGFELLDNQKQKQIEKIKNLLIKKVQSGEVEEHFSITNYLAKPLNKDYSYISRLFSEVEGITIEQFLILQKIEKVKELIIYNEMNFSEISYKLGYSSIAHLSAQFKKVTGLTPSHFKKAGKNHRKSLDNIKSMRSSILIAFVTFIFLSGCKNENSNQVIAAGQMPNVIKDNSGYLHLVYGYGDSILYCYSSDQGHTFSPASLISVLPKLAASHTRGPQIAATADGLAVTACNDLGDIFSFVRDPSGKWSQTARVNDMDTVAKENLMALAADGQTAFAIWLDIRDKHNKIFGARSTDGGKTWSKNSMIYASPDATVCECCKPSVQIKGNNVYVMFRNWLGGNRDLYLIHSSDGGLIFGEAQKLGTGSWALNGCPMDGGGIAINNNGNPETVWNRKGVIYACEPGKEERKLGNGRNCTIESVNGKSVYAWVEDGEVIILNPKGVKTNLGKGQLPVIKAINNGHILCVWENDKQIHKAIVEL